MRPTDRIKPNKRSLNRVKLVVDNGTAYSARSGERVHIKRYRFLKTQARGDLDGDRTKRMVSGFAE